MQNDKTNQPKRHGITTVMNLAAALISSKAEACLSSSRYNELEAAKGGALFVAANYPGSDWEQVIGFDPDKKMFHEVTVGIAVHPGQDLNIFAKALISRDASSDFCHIIWEPLQQAR